MRTCASVDWRLSTSGIEPPAAALAAGVAEVVDPLPGGGDILVDDDNAGVGPVGGFETAVSVEARDAAALAVALAAPAAAAASGSVISARSSAGSEASGRVASPRPGAPRASSARRASSSRKPSGRVASGFVTSGARASGRVASDLALLDETRAGSAGALAPGAAETAPLRAA